MCLFVFYRKTQVEYASQKRVKNTTLQDIGLKIAETFLALSLYHFSAFTRILTLTYFDLNFLYHL